VSNWVKRKIVQLAQGAQGTVIALAEDGSLWAWSGGTWGRLEGLPDADACGANIDRKGDSFVCERYEGHPGKHYSSAWGEF
jgi:hypothetical protein